MHIYICIICIALYCHFSCHQRAQQFRIWIEEYDLKFVSIFLKWGPLGKISRSKKSVLSWLKRKFHNLPTIQALCDCLSMAHNNILALLFAIILKWSGRHIITISSSFGFSISFYGCFHFSTSSTSLKNNWAIYNT